MRRWQEGFRNPWKALVRRLSWRPGRSTHLGGALVAVVAGAALAWGASVGRAAAPAPLWTERAILPPRATGEPSPWVELARRLKPAVVNINTTRREPGVPAPEAEGGGDAFEDFLRRFYGAVSPRPVRSLGSGFIINPDGYVVTNDHVVDGATEIRVKLSDGRELAASVVGRDRKTDLALLKIDATGLPVVPLGDAAGVQVGEPVMAIGNPFGLEQTVTTGIVSATGRVIGAGPYDDFIQTDASINPGNSGGPLINARGQAIGINTAIFTRDGGSNGIGFAIPMSVAKPVLRQLAAAGHVVRGWVGVAIQPLTPDLARGLHAPGATGALVASVVRDSPAMKAGIEPGDIIVEYAGRPVARFEELPRAVADTPVGREVRIALLREGQRLVVTARVERLVEAGPRAGVPASGPARLGLAVESLTPQVAREVGVAETRGVLVRGVDDAGRAAKAGIEPGDVIVAVDRHPVATVADLERRVERHRGDSPLLVLVHRRGESLFIAVG